MDAQARYNLTMEFQRIEQKPMMKWGPVRVFFVAGIQFLVSASVAVDAIRIVKMSNWFVVPLVLVALVLAATATYNVVMYGIDRKFRAVIGAMLADGRGSEAVSKGL